MLASVYSYRVMVKSISSCCVRVRRVLLNPVTYIITTLHMVQLYCNVLSTQFNLVSHTGSTQTRELYPCELRIYACVISIRMSLSINLLLLIYVHHTLHGISVKFTVFSNHILHISVNMHSFGFACKLYVNCSVCMLPICA